MIGLTLLALEDATSMDEAEEMLGLLGLALAGETVQGCTLAFWALGGCY